MRKASQNPRIVHPLNDELYQYRLGTRFDPGAEAEVFEPLFQNPVIMFRGAGKVAGSLSKLQHPQVYFNYQTGINGIPTIAGQIIQQPLLNPDEPV